MVSVVLDFQLDASIEKFWMAWTVSEIFEKTIWKNNFKPVVGYEF